MPACSARAGRRVFSDPPWRAEAQRCPIIFGAASAHATARQVRRRLAQRFSTATTSSPWSGTLGAAGVAILSPRVEKGKRPRISIATCDLAASQYRICAAEQLVDLSSHWRASRRRQGAAGVLRASRKTSAVRAAALESDRATGSFPRGSSCPNCAVDSWERDHVTRTIASRTRDGAISRHAKEPRARSSIPRIRSARAELWQRYARS